MPYYYVPQKKYTFWITLITRSQKHRLYRTQGSQSFGQWQLFGIAYSHEAKAPSRMPSQAVAAFDTILNQSLIPYSVCKHARTSHGAQILHITGSLPKHFPKASTSFHPGQIRPTPLVHEIRLSRPQILCTVPTIYSRYRDLSLGKSLLEHLSQSKLLVCINSKVDDMYVPYLVGHNALDPA